MKNIQKILIVGLILCSSGTPASKHMMGTKRTLSKLLYTGVFLKLLFLQLKKRI